MYVERELANFFNELIKHFSLIALVGPRQAGKTTFLKNRAVEKLDYLLFDDVDIKRIFDEDIKSFERQFLSKDRIAILDEIQVVDEPGRKLKYLVDTGYRLWITSSSEIILSQKVLSYLVGRVTIQRLFPFNLFEFLSAKKIQIQDQILINRELKDHIKFGGYPKVVLTDLIEIKKTILRDLLETIVLKDIAFNFSINDILTLQKMIEYLAANVCSILNYGSINQALKISFPTIKKYLDALEKSYIIYSVRPFFTNKNKELSKQPKIYFLDNGILNQTLKDYEINGLKFENYIFTEILKAGFHPKYWRNKHKNEVDFVIEKGKQKIPIEVKLSFHNKIESGLKIFINEYQPQIAFIVILEGEEKDIELNGCKIKVRFVNNFLNEIKVKQINEA
ncbi:MAG: ATP-binding protein [Ignavibacteria bacterium]|nr:ATP-binding protein [Ignavibacteria bacterium]